MSTNKLRQEREIIGRLLVEYGEMELDLCNCVAMGIDDLDMALKAMFRARGETLRIDISEAIEQKVYVSLAFRAGVPPEQKSCGRTLAEDLCWVRMALTKLT
jgi:hypothetical protein